jgi:DNA-binding LacI/PurR family transcriptional regulator
MVSPPPQRRRVTVQDVAAAAGTSRGSVGRVLRGDGYVSAEARAAIEAAIERTGYVPSASARNLVMRRTQAVAVVLREPLALFVEDSNIGTVLLGVNAVLAAADHQMLLLVIDSDEDTRRVARHIGGGIADAVIMFSSSADDDLMRVIRRQRIPVAMFGSGRDLDLPHATFVGTDNRAASREIVARMRERRRRVAMIRSTVTDEWAQERYEGYRDALGADFDDELVEPVDYFTADEGATAMERLLQRRPDLDGVFGASDAIAAGALRVLQAHERRVPQEVAVVGFDDSVWAGRTDPPLSTVRQPAREMGAAAAEAVLTAIAGDEAPRELQLASELVWRGSA